MRFQKITLSILILVTLTTISPILSNATDDSLRTEIISRSQADPVLNLIIIWHQHQPSYQDPETKIYEQPWVFMHGTNSYPYMADVLNDYPDINVTINLTPSLLKQLDDYISRSAWDRRLELIKMDESSMSYENKSVVLQYFFDINSQFRQNGSRYNELSERRNQYSTLGAAVNGFTDQEYLDLKILFLSHWINPRYTTLEKYPVVNITLENDVAGNHYSSTDKNNILNYAYTLVDSALTFHDSLQDQGRLEIMTTPFYHPILPLLINLSSARETDPGNANLPLPTNNTGWSDDALAQIQKGRNFTNDHFGEYPNGMWPSEQAVSPDIIPLVNQSGMNWIVTDYNILEKGLGVSTLTPEQWYKPYRVTKDGKSIVVFYRNQELSDEVGFNYGGLPPDTASTNLVNYLKNIRDSWTGTDDPVFTVALDGENAWEHYQYDLDGDGKTEYTANMFREMMYAKIEQAQDDGWLKTITPSQYLSEHPVETLDEVPLKTGSWAGDLTVWIGEDDENLAWDRLITAREYLVSYQAAHPIENLSDAWESLYAAEGSDWFWWYGTDRDSSHDELFDWAFKLNLRSVYKGIGWTDEQIINEFPELFLQLKPVTQGPFKGKEKPTIDGQLTTATEWSNGAHYNDTGHDDIVDFIGNIYASVDDDLDDIYLRIDTTSSFPVASLSGYSLGIYFFDPSADYATIFPRFADTTNQSHVLGFELATELRIDFNDLSKVSIYKVNSSRKWNLTAESLTDIAVSDFVELTVPLTAINAKKGDNVLISFVATDEGKSENIDVTPQDGPWLLGIPFGGVTMTEIFSMNDPAEDEHGIYPTNPQMHPDGDVTKQGLMDILRFRIGYDSDNVIFEFKFAAMTNVWNSPAGYSHPLMQVYIDKDNVKGSGSTECDQNGHFSIEEEHAWEVMVRADGWLQYIYWPNGTETSGVTTLADAIDKIIVYKAPLSVVGTPTDDWSYVVVVGSQDFQAFREFYTQPQEWKFGGGDDSEYDPNLVDLLTPEGMNQADVLNSYSIAEKKYAVLPAVGPKITYETDTESPQVTITSPTDDPHTVSLASGTTDATISVTWSATDNVEIDHFDLFVGNEFLAEVSATTMSYDFTLESGEHVIKINAYDTSDNFGSASITINVEQAQEPPPGFVPGFTVLTALIALPFIVLYLKRKK
ncbi:MAG: glucodextranase DOMON-like domain-containing protein [Candidatus Hodarchaeales archaeon]|jgi:alpha-amylase/alpha-mannosidase (GH57 family)